MTERSHGGLPTIAIWFNDEGCVELQGWTYMAVYPDGHVKSFLFECKSSECPLDGHPLWCLRLSGQLQDECLSDLSLSAYADKYDWAEVLEEDGSLVGTPRDIFSRRKSEMIPEIHKYADLPEGWQWSPMQPCSISGFTYLLGPNGEEIRVSEVEWPGASRSVEDVKKEIEAALESQRRYM